MNFQDQILRLDIQGDDLQFGRLIFRYPAAFRMVDEEQLFEYAPEVNMSRGWLWEVLSGGWLDQERKRDPYLAAILSGHMREYLVLENTCLSVITMNPPEFVQVGKGWSEA